MSLPDVMRPRLSRPARDLARAIARVAAAATWRTLHPSARERYVEAPKPPPLARVHYVAPDGWRAPLHVLPAAPGGAGEPVVLAHPQLLSGDAYRYGAGGTLAAALTEAGFSVYLLAHRGDPGSEAPARVGELDFDAIVERDVPAALAAVAAHSGFPRAHWVGHGLGGQLGLVAAGRQEDRVASVVALASPVRFSGRSEFGRAARVASVFPPHWAAPSRLVARLSCPLVGDAALADQLVGGVSPAARVRGTLHHTSQDLPFGMLAQGADWLRTGTLCSRGGVIEYADLLRHAQVPLLVLVGDADGRIAVDDAAHAASVWGDLDADVTVVPGYGALDLLLGQHADDDVFSELVHWLVVRRRAAWGGGVASIDDAVVVDGVALRAVG